MADTENKRLRKAILDVVENQLRDGKPPETGATLKRLMSQGIAEDEARKLIGYVVASEVFEVLGQGRTYDEEQFIAALKALPKLPWQKDK